ncbi:MAG: hypothetical protein QM731_14885 [Chitinophagaceae bacterium]
MNKFKKLNRFQMKTILGGLVGDGGGGTVDCSQECDSATEHSCECMDAECPGNNKQYCEKIGTGCKHGTC